MKIKILTLAALIALSGCTYLQVTTPNPGEVTKTVVVKGKALQPLTGPVTLEEPICDGGPLLGFKQRVTSGQYWYNAFLGFLGPKFTIDFYCGN